MKDLIVKTVDLIVVLIVVLSTIFAFFVGLKSGYAVGLLCAAAAFVITSFIVGFWILASSILDTLNRISRKLEVHP